MTKALAIVAHHDDALLWMGGTMLRTSRQLDWQWTVIAVCVPDPARQENFRDCCAAFGVAHRHLAFADYQAGQAFTRNKRADVQAALANQITGQSFDWVFTHARGPHGEYGRHANHVECRELTTELVGNGLAGRGKPTLGYFSYVAAYGLAGLATVASPNASHYLQLT